MEKLLWIKKISEIYEDTPRLNRKTYGNAGVINIFYGLNLSLSNDEITRMAKEENAGLVGISCLSDFYLETKELTAKLKKEGLRVVLGGAHPSALPEETLRDTGADFAVVGEGEETLLELVDALERKTKTEEMPGLAAIGSAFKKRAFIPSLDSIPFPDWRQIDPRKCKKAPHGAVVKNFPVAPVTTSRGCPYVCKFCASPHLWSRIIRFRSPENVVDEIEYLVRDFGVREIHFEDDNLTLRKDHIEKICELILKRNLRISWATPNGVRVDSLTKDLVRLMKKSGCYFIVFGIESANQRILDNIDKKIDLETVERAVRLANSEGIITQGFFIFGLPGETEDTIQETIDFARTTPLDRAQFLLLDVLPGSQLWNELDGPGIADWHRRSYQEVSWVPPTVRKDILEKAPSRAFKSFFFRPKQLFNTVRYMKWSQLSFIIRRLTDFRIIPAGRR